MAASVSIPEVELKLTVPAAALGRLAAHRLLRGRSRTVKRRLYSVYFDTPALDLWRRGVALRVRRDGGRWLQTVKDEGSVEAGLHRRTGLESGVAGPHPDIAQV